MSRETLLEHRNQDKKLVKNIVEQITGCQVRENEISKLKVHAFSNRIKKYIDTEIKVGEEMNLELADIPHTKVLAIFKSKDYLVVTPDTSTENKHIYFFSEDEVSGVE